jgi:predicted dehydrogenase
MVVHGVGVIGAGPGVAAVHLPTLARLAHDFAVVHIADAGSGRAVGLAEAVGARSSSGIDELLADPSVEVVAICSPPAQHAEQILASVAAGARAILCEKPIALTADDAEAVIAACREAGTVLIVGTNHLFDPVWGRAKHHLDATRGAVHAVSITVSLPPNGRYHDVVTELGPDGAPPRGAPDWSNPVVAASVVRQLVLGLAIHDLPALRDIVPRLDDVIYARPLSPIGYTIAARGGETLVSLTAVMLPAGADAHWRMSISTALERLDVDFPPTFVHAGSARAGVRGANGQLTEYPTAAEDGYVEEWRALAALLDDGATIEYEHILDDARYAVHLADAAHAAVLEGYEP